MDQIIYVSLILSYSVLFIIAVTFVVTKWNKFARNDQKQ